MTIYSCKCKCCGKDTIKYKHSSHSALRRHTLILSYNPPRSKFKWKAAATASVRGDSRLNSLGTPTCTEDHCEFHSTRQQSAALDREKVSEHTEEKDIMYLSLSVTDMTLMFCFPTACAANSLVQTIILITYCLNAMKTFMVLRGCLLMIYRLSFHLVISFLMTSTSYHTKSYCQIFSYICLEY